MKNKTYTGINIQYPITKDILAGSKTIETRTYPLPPSFFNKTLLIVETPGKTGNFKSRIVGKIKFKNCFKYASELDFYKDYNKHLVDKTSPWRWNKKPKWAWVIAKVTKLPPKMPNKRLGIRYTKDLVI